MRSTFLAVGLALGTAVLATALPRAATAGEWCGFHDAAGSRVRCGFSNLGNCKQALGDSKAEYCIPDPNFAFRLRSQPPKVSVG